MKTFRAGGYSLAALMCASSFLLLASAETCLAQRGGPGATAAGRRVDTLNRQGEQYERDHRASERESPADAAAERRRAREAAEQVKRDFGGLQDAYNKIVLSTAPGKTPDPDSILESVNEVKKCAARLKHSLALPKPREEEAHRARVTAEPPGADEALRLLRKHIYSFVTNPLFEGLPVLDVEQATKAARDLDMILELSEGIRRGGLGAKARHD